tara:strand:+ start:744 stop:1025 length:282 start_codon:yes stop_codon:yes gene_type:complete
MRILKKRSIKAIARIRTLKESLNILRSIKPVKSDNQWTHFVKIESNLTNLLDEQCKIYLGNNFFDYEDKWLLDEKSVCWNFGDWCLDNNIINI